MAMEAQSSTWPAIWSALAASLSAIAAFLALRLNSRMTVDSVRPELFLGEFKVSRRSCRDYGASDEYFEIEVEKIMNAGNGPALDTSVYARQRSIYPPVRPMSPREQEMLDIEPIASMNTATSFIAAGESVGNTPLNVTLYPESAPRAPHQVEMLYLHIRCYDFHGRYHQTIIECFMTLADNGDLKVYPSKRTRRIEPVWYARLRFRILIFIGTFRARWAKSRTPAARPILR